MPRKRFWGQIQVLKQNYLKNDQDWFQLFDVEYLEERNAHTFEGNELSMVNLNFLFLWCLRKWEQAASSSTSTDFLEFMDKFILIFFFWPILFILPMHWVPPTFCLFLMNLFTYKNGSLVKLSRCKQQVARAYQGQEAYSQGVSAARTIGSSYPCG